MILVNLRMRLQKGLSLSPKDKQIKQTINDVKNKMKTALYDNDDNNDVDNIDVDNNMIDVEVTSSSSSSSSSSSTTLSISHNKENQRIENNKIHKTSPTKKKEKKKEELKGMKKTSKFQKTKKKDKEFTKDPDSFIRPKLPKHAPSSSSSVMVECSSSTGSIYIEVFKSWAPIGANRFLELVNTDFFSSKVALYRVVSNFVVQFGINGDSSVTQKWDGKLIKDDEQWLKRPMKFEKGFISFAGGGPNSRNTQLFISLARIDLGEAPHEVPFGRLISAESFKTMAKWYNGYGELSVFGGHAPDPDRMLREGVSYTEKEFPKLDYISECRVLNNKKDKVDVVSNEEEEEQQQQQQYNQVEVEVEPQSETKTIPIRVKDVDYIRSIPPPIRALPIYQSPTVKEYSHGSHENTYFWWLGSLKKKLESYNSNRHDRSSSSSSSSVGGDSSSSSSSVSGDSSSSSRNMCSQNERPFRYNLNPNELHVVENFLPKQDRIEVEHTQAKRDRERERDITDTITYRYIVNHICCFSVLCFFVTFVVVSCI